MITRAYAVNEFSTISNASTVSELTTKSKQALNIKQHEAMLSWKLFIANERLRVVVSIAFSFQR